MQKYNKKSKIRTEMSKRYKQKLLSAKLPEFILGYKKELPALRTTP